MRRRVAGLVVLWFTASSATGFASPALDADAAHTLYAYGYELTHTFADLKPNTHEQAMFTKGLNDALTGHVQVDPKPFLPLIEQVSRKMAARRNAEFLAQQAKVKGAHRFPSGLILTELKPGTGPSPGASDVVGLRFWGKLLDGAEFESTYSRPHDPVAEFRVDNVVPCWTEALQKLRVGGKARVVCPSELAYGVQGQLPRVPPMAVLVFEIELVDARPTSSISPKPPWLQPPPQKRKPMGQQLQSVPPSTVF